MKTILVTGGAGFIGSHTCLALLKKQYKIKVVDSFINSNPNSLKRVKKICDLSNIPFNLEIIEADLRDNYIIDNIFYQAKNINQPIEGVIHFAGLKAVNDSVKNPLVYWDANLNSSINLLKAMGKNDCRTIVFSSSATVYGLSENKYFKESDYLSPINPYGHTKLAIENILRNLYDSSPDEWRVINLRYFNPIGAHESGLIGENPNGKPNNIFPLILQVASGKIPKLKIFGSDWDTIDGTGVRDYIHVMDLAEGHLLALEYLFQRGGMYDINIGTGKGTSVLELIKTFQRVTNISFSYEFTSRRDGDIARIVADNSLVKSILGWRPKKNLADMCTDGWRWQQNIS